MTKLEKIKKKLDAKKGQVDRLNAEVKLARAQLRRLEKEFKDESAAETERALNTKAREFYEAHLKAKAKRLGLPAPGQTATNSNNHTETKQ